MPAGIVAALRKDHAADVAVRVVSITGISFPVFWLGIILQLVFFYYLGQLGLPNLPSRGRIDDLVSLEYPLDGVTGFFLIDSLISGNLPFFASALRHLVLPAFALSLISLATIVRIMRASMLEVLRQDYILLARSKGLPARTIVLIRHALRNAITPVLTTAGTTLGILLGGAVVVETVFSWPGMGLLAVQGILNNDSVLVVGFTLFVATMMVLVNLVVDLLYAVVDPRVQILTSGSERYRPGSRPWSVLCDRTGASVALARGGRLHRRVPVDFGRRRRRASPDRRLGGAQGPGSRLSLGASGRASLVRHRLDYGRDLFPRWSCWRPIWI